MTFATVDTGRIDNNYVAEYLASADRRVAIGVRFTLETLGIELPDFLQRKPAGRPGRAALKGIIPPVPTLGDIEPRSPEKPAEPHILNMYKENT